MSVYHGAIFFFDLQYCIGILIQLAEENSDTWEIQMSAFLIKNDEEGNRVTTEAVQKWVEADLKTQPDIILAMNPSEIKQIKGCRTVRET